jgi:hypothetical protein
MSATGLSMRNGLDVVIFPPATGRHDVIHASATRAQVHDGMLREQKAQGKKL